MVGGPPNGVHPLRSKRCKQIHTHPNKPIWGRTQGSISALPRKAPEQPCSMPKRVCTMASVLFLVSPHKNRVSPEKMPETGSIEATSNDSWFGRTTHPTQTTITHMFTRVEKVSEWVTLADHFREKHDSHHPPRRTTFPTRSNLRFGHGSKFSHQGYQGSDLATDF